MGRYIQQPVRNFNPGITDTKEFYGSGQYRIFSSSTTWTVPTGVSSVRVTALGAGGGGGGHWLAQEDGGSCLGGFCTAHFRGSLSMGGNGGGGAYTVGIASVTPGCVCCVVVGAGGATSETCYKWVNSGSMSHCCCAGSDTTKLCACCGADGGFSCALGICAPGGKGGGMGRCGCGGLDCNIWCVRTNYSTYCACIDAGCSGCICGGAGGSGGNGFVTYCGGDGGVGCWRECGSNSFLWCAHGYGNAGAAGSPLGHGSGAVIPNLFNSLAFDGSSDTESLLILKYDLPNPRWCGQVIYTQASGTLGSPGGGTTTCSGSGTSLCCLVAKFKWQAPCQGFTCCVGCDTGGGTYCVCCSTGQTSCGGLGSGGLHYCIAGYPYEIGGSSACNCCRLRICSGPGSCAKAGEVILEW